MRQYRPDDVTRVLAEMKRDRERLFAVCRERNDGADLVACIVRLTENSLAFAHYAGIRRGYKIGVEVGKDSEQEKIFQIVQKHLDATPTEICKLLDAHNSQFDDLRDKRCVHLRWPGLARNGFTLWVDVASVPKVKNYLERVSKKAREIYRIQGWQRVMREHVKRRRPPKRTDLPH